MAKRKQQTIDGESWVSVEEQEAQGLRRPRPQGQGQFVEPEQKPIVRRVTPPPAELGRVEHTLNIPQTVQQVVQVRTSSVDRSKGYLIKVLPAFAGFGVGAVLIAVFWWDVPLLSLPALVIFWLTFIGAWGLSFAWDSIVSPDGIGLIEVLFRGAVVWREQTKRWEYYDRHDRGE